MISPSNTVEQLTHDDSLYPAVHHLRQLPERLRPVLGATVSDVRRARR